MKAIPALFLLVLAAAACPIAASTPVDFDTAFADHSHGQDLHFIAHYTDAGGKTHRLEEWRQGRDHLRRRTDDRIDLHADATARPRTGTAGQYLWQVIDLEKKIDHRIQSQDMLQAGMLYNFWSMAHVILRPAGRFTVTQLAPGTHPQPATAPEPCTWYQLAPEAQPKSHVCWSAASALPMVILAEQRDGSYQQTFAVESLSHEPIAPATFAIDARGLRIEDASEFNDRD